MRSFRSLAATFAISLAMSLAACQSGGPVTATRSGDNPAQSARSAQAYALGTGDQVRITVFGQPDLSGEFEVSGAGAISMPLIGQISVVGKTTPSLEQAITVKLADGFLREPRVSAEVINYRPFYILGEVSTPGEYPYASGLSVLNAVASAGGFTYRANKKTVYIKSIDGLDEEAFQLNSQVLVRPGDTVRIGERLF